MRVVHGLDEVNSSARFAATSGIFDGIHIGHQRIFSELRRISEETGFPPAVIAFDPRPVNPKRKLRLLLSREDMVVMLERLGIELLVVIPFDRKLASLSPESFAEEYLCGALRSGAVVTGSRYTFGRGGKGTPALLRRLGKKHDFSVKVVRNATMNGSVISSAGIRSLLMRGEVEKAAQLLGRPFHIGGTVVRGAGRGTPVLNVPTANIVPVQEFLPKEGVYAVKVTAPRDQPAGSLSGNPGASSGVSFWPFNRQSPDCPVVVYDGVANIGKNPTFGGGTVHYEVHALNVREDFLGKRLRVHFIGRIRDERKFSSISELRAAIDADKEKAASILDRRAVSLYGDGVGIG